MKDARAERHLLSHAAARAVLWLLNDLPATLENFYYPLLQTQGVRLTPAELAAVSALGLAGGAGQRFGTSASKVMDGEMIVASDSSAVGGRGYGMLLRTASTASDDVASGLRGTDSPAHAELRCGGLTTECT